MAMNPHDTRSEAMSRGRRFSVGANVVLSVVLAAALLFAVNAFCSLRNVRKDLATAGNYGLSDRTKRIVEGTEGGIRISTVYPPKEDDAKQQEYIIRLQDYCDELRRFSNKIEVVSVVSSSQREKLVSRISETFGGEAGKHKEALDAFGKLGAELETELKQRHDEVRTLMDGDTWLGDFPLFANIAAVMQSDIETLKKASQEINELTPAGGIPKYADATAKAKTALTEIKGHLKAIGGRLGELAALAQETAKLDSTYIAALREVAAAPDSLVASLRAAVGQENAAAPADVASALKAFADRSSEASGQLDQLVERIGTFSRKFPMVRQHPNWSAQTKMGPLVAQVEVAGVLQEIGKMLGNRRLIILGILDSGKPEQLAQELTEAREDVSALEKNAAVCKQLLTGLADRLSRVDEGSKRLLDSVAQAAFLGDRTTAIDAMEKQIDGLPELKLGSVADQLKEDNVVVVEGKSKIRVLTFAEVFPLRDSVAGPGKHAEELGHTFNGDSAISSAILAITRDKPCATIMLTFFEPPPPQQRNQFMMPPPESWIPSRALSQLRTRLEAASFKVVDWNMATTDAPPPGEEGVDNLYLLLPPPPPSQPNPFGGQPPNEKTFGEPQRQRIRDLLNNDANMVFLATWEARGGGFGGPPSTPPYGYAPLLDQDWGITVDNAKRIVWLEPDRRDPRSFGVKGQRFGHMPAGGFTDHEIGKPLRGTRFLIADSCILKPKSDLPSGVTIREVLAIPRKENYNAVSINQIVQIIDQVRQHASEGKVSFATPPETGPFDVMLTAERRDGEKGKGKIVVMAFGGSLRDDYLESPVLAEAATIRFDPPPTENADLFVNALYWLTGHPEWIGRGPLPVPRIASMNKAELNTLRIFVWGIWPAMVFLPGVLLWYVRRK
jgi:hypothetical protein